MTKNQCIDCICLVADENGNWICDELQKLCSEVKKCPETGEEAEEE